MNKNTLDPSKSFLLTLSSKKTALMLALGLCLVPLCSGAEEPGVTDKTIRVGSTMALEGDLKVFGQNAKLGVETALSGQIVQKRSIEYTVMNDLYDPAKTVENTKQLISNGLFTTIFSMGTATVQASLPILAENKIPVFAPYTGARLARSGEVLNFRVPYTTEVAEIIEIALANGLKPTEICAYIQNDGLGLSGLRGMRDVLAKHSGTESITAKLDQIINLPGDSPERNRIGPVGLHERNNYRAKAGYDSLKKWEKDTGNACRLITIIGVYPAAAEFIGYARYKNEPWFFSTISLTPSEVFAGLLREKGVTDQVIVTETVPPLDSSLPIVVEARKALGSNLNYVSLEGYIVGKLFLAIMQAIEGPLTRENFLKAARRQPYDIGGIKVDFTTDNQGSDFVGLTFLQDSRFVPITAQDPDLLRLFK